jgi:hypothetical protein
MSMKPGIEGADAVMSGVDKEHLINDHLMQESGQHEATSG